MYEIERKSDGCFQSDDAKRRLIEFESLLVSVVRSVIRGDSVDADRLAFPAV